MYGSIFAYDSGCLISGSMYCYGSTRTWYVAISLDVQSVCILYPKQIHMLVIKQLMIGLTQQNRAI